MKKDDSQLVAEYLAGNAQALNELIERYSADVRHFVLKLVQQPNIADDITQDAFVQAWEHIRSFRPGKSFRAWIFTIAHNKAVDFLRARREVAASHMAAVSANANAGAGIGDEQADIFEHTATDEDGPDVLFDRARTVEFVQSLLAELKPEYKEIVLMKENQATFAEISVALSKPLNTVKSQYRRAIEALRAALKTVAHKAR